MPIVYIIERTHISEGRVVKNIGIVRIRTHDTRLQDLRLNQ